ncbi:MAG: RNA ligase [Actinomycetaceae bacterium]|nr:RNA ligase [Actinomycetaceae bacterium]
MRKLFVTRGIPGSGKSTFLREAGLEPYSLSPDTLRLAVASPEMDEHGRIGISPRNDRLVWRTLYETLEARLGRGELVVIDATNTTSRSLTDFGKLAKKYRYRCYLIDLADVPLEVCRERNVGREEYKIVDDSVLVTMHERLATCVVPKYYTVLTTQEDVARELTVEPRDLSQYRRIHHIGDIQGCFTPLREYFERHPVCADEFYVFVGDLLDRGTENDEVLAYVCEHLVDRPNVVFVEGNHDLYLRQWASGQPVASQEFNGRTRPQLERADLDMKAVRRLTYALRDVFYYAYHGRRVLVTHAGLSTLPASLALISSAQFIRGTGAYGDVGAIDDTFVDTTPNDVYQIHGHRNPHNVPSAYNERCFNLEGKVEFGGHLRAVQLTPEGFEVVEVANTVPGLKLFPENAPLVHSLRRNRLIAEKTLPDGINSYNFKPQVFYKKQWTRQTMTARGLFINSLTNEFVIRAYDKFFNIGERRETELASLKDTMTFPARAWLKENGFLGLVGYDSVTDRLIFASKSTTESDYAREFKRLFTARHGDRLDCIKEYLRDANSCLVTEVILPDFDPHIIEYPGDDIVLLDIVRRRAEFEAAGQQEREAFGERIGLRVKTCAAEFGGWEDFAAWYESVRGMDYEFDGQPVEGFVIEDASGRMVKAKLDFYVFWKQMRGVLAAITDGRAPRVPGECEFPELAERVVAFMCSLPAEELAGASIIDVRRRWQARKGDAEQDDGGSVKGGSAQE